MTRPGSTEGDGRAGARSPARCAVLPVRRGVGVRARRPTAEVAHGRRRTSPLRRTRLVDVHGRPLVAANLAAETNYVFQYPCGNGPRRRPCLLLNAARLRGTPCRSPAEARGAGTGAATWQGGDGHGSATSWRSRRSARTSSPTRRARSRSSATSARSRPPRAARSSIAAPTTASTTRRRARASRPGLAAAAGAAILLEHDAGRRSVRARHRRARPVRRVLRQVRRGASVREVDRRGQRRSTDSSNACRCS